MHKNTEQYQNDPEYRARQLAYKKKQQERWTPEQKAAKAAYLKEYRAKNRERLAQLDKDYHERTKEDGRNRLWKDAELERTKERRKADPEYAEKRREACRTWYASKPREEHYERELRKEYGLTRAHVARMYEAQGGLCDICREPAPKLCVDHCHASNQVRALLCSACNKGLGTYWDNPEKMERAAAFIRFHNPDKVWEKIEGHFTPPPGVHFVKGANTRPKKRAN